MRFGNRRRGKLTAWGLDQWIFQPRGEQLEDKVLLSIDLGGTSPPAQPIIASAPFGMDFAGATQSLGSGFSVADVGDVNGAGFDDFVIGSPTVGSTPAILGGGVNSTVFLVLGSQTSQGVGVAPTITNWLATNTTGQFLYTANDRVGSLGQIGQVPQQNPISGTNLTFPFPGIAFQTSTLNLTSNLGASVAGLRLPSGQGAILIGAPGALDANNLNPGTGRVYLLFGAFNSFIGDTINLDLSDTAFAAAFPGLNRVTFVNSGVGAGGQLGRSVAGGFNIFADGATDVILGAPAATVAPSTPTTVPANTGVVYVMSTALLNGSTQTINVSTLGQSGTQSVTLSGVNSGDRAGFSVADAGDVNGATAGGSNIDDLLIGAPQNSSQAGVAYLVYGASNLANLATTTNGVRFINLGNVGAASGTTGAVPGAIITGPQGGDFLGFAVSSAGDFNNDGFSDILLGAPNFTGSTTTGSQGAVFLLYGAASGSTAALTGTIPLSNIPTALPSVTLVGANAGDMAGYALTPVGFINSGQPNPILIGAPGFNSSAGSAYLIPGRAGFTGTFSLAGAEASPLSGVQFRLTTPSSPSSSPNFFGASVSSRFQDTSFTADADSRADFIIGAPGYDVTQSVTGLTALPLAGGAMVVQSALFTLPIPPSNLITTQIGVGQAFGPFSINATTPANLQIFVFGSTTTTPNFMPVTDINPATVVVNGVAFPNATLQQDPNTADYLNGIPDAIITISPRSSLNLPNGVDTITITGQTLPTSPLAGFTWTGSAAVTVTGGTVSPIASLAGVPRGPVLQTTFLSAFGANQYTPSLTQLSALNYQPIPLQVALAQFLPPNGFRQRIYAFNHPGKLVGPNLLNRGQSRSRASGIHTLSYKVFDRARFHPQRNYKWTHTPPKAAIVNGVIPIQAKRQRFDDNLLH
jgi:hypothetical protein